AALPGVGVRLAAVPAAGGRPAVGPVPRLPHAAGALLQQRGSDRGDAAPLPLAAAVGRAAAQLVVRPLRPAAQLARGRPAQPRVVPPGGRPARLPRPLRPVRGGPRRAGARRPGRDPLLPRRRPPPPRGGLARAAGGPGRLVLLLFQLRL